MLSQRATMKLVALAIQHFTACKIVVVYDVKIGVIFSLCKNTKSNTQHKIH